VLESEAVVSCFKDVALEGQTDEECGRHLGITKDRGPFAEARVGCADNAGSLVELTQQGKEQLRLNLTKTGQLLIAGDWVLIWPVTAMGERHRLTEAVEGLGWAQAETDETA